MVRKTLFKTTAIGERDHLNSKYSKETWRFIANEQSEGVNGWKITKRMYQG